MTKKRYDVKVSDHARQMLGEQVRFVGNVSQKAGQKVRADIVRGIRSLSDMPERYPFFAGEFIPPNKYRKCYVPPYYLILYYICEQTVYVDFIDDCRGMGLINEITE